MDLQIDIKKKLKDFTLQACFSTAHAPMGILGASGSGKSMVLRCIAGIETPDSGRIVLNGRVLSDSAQGIHIPARNRKVGLVFQNYALFPHMTVEQNIAFALEGVPSRERAEKVSTRISMMKLHGLEKRYPGQLSGGQQQRVALARALAAEPEALLLDEPFSALDEYLRSHMVEQLIDSLADYKGAVLFVTHDMEEAYRVCKNIIILHNGRIESCGHKDEVFHKPPTTASARITGCKNLSAVSRVSENILDAVDWGCRLTAGNISDGITCTGIRANHIRIADEGATCNVFDSHPVFISETPFKTTLYLSIGEPVQAAGKHSLQWEITGEQWLTLKEIPFPWKIHLPPEKLLLLRD